MQISLLAVDLCTLNSINRFLSQSGLFFDPPSPMVLIVLMVLMVLIVLIVLMNQSMMLKMMSNYSAVFDVPLCSLFLCFFVSLFLCSVVTQKSTLCLYRVRLSACSIAHYPYRMPDLKHLCFSMKSVVA
jgi:hypothetical protein